MTVALFMGHGAATRATTHEEFSYQGYLEKGSPPAPLTDTCTLEFKLCNDATAACAPGTVSNRPGVAVTGGVFNTTIDFGANAFTGDARWMEVSVQCTGDGGPVALSPRVKLTPTPYALHAEQATGLLLPYISTAATSTPMLELTQTGDAPVARFETDAGELVPAVYVANDGAGMAIIVVNNNPSPTFEATNNGGGSAGKFEAVAFNPQPDPPQPAIVATHHGGGGAAKFESVAFNPQPDPPQPTVEAIHQGGGSAGKFESVAFNPQPDPPQPTIVATHLGGGGAAKFESVAFNPQPDPPQPTIEAIHHAGGSAGRFETDAGELVPAVYVAHTGAGVGIIVVNSNPSPTLEATNNGTGPAMKALSGNIGSPTFEATNSAGTAIKAMSSNGMCFDGVGDLRVTGEITRNYGNGAPSFHRTAPIAYATINSDGTVAAGTPNVSSAWNVPNLRYEITITGETYAATTHVTTVTPVASGLPEALFATTGSGGDGKLRIRIMSSSTGTTGLQKPFQFIVYRP